MFYQYHKEVSNTNITNGKHGFNYKYLKKKIPIRRGSTPMNRAKNSRNKKDHYTLRRETPLNKRDRENKYCIQTNILTMNYMLNIIQTKLL